MREELCPFHLTSCRQIVSPDWGRRQMVLLDSYRVIDITAWGKYFLLKSLTYLKIKKCSAGQYHIYAPSHWVDVTFCGAIALAVR
jgi:hypothetical protein